MHRYYTSYRSTYSRVCMVTFVFFASFPNAGHMISSFAQVTYLHTICSWWTLLVSHDLSRLTLCAAVYNKSRWLFKNPHCRWCYDVGSEFWKFICPLKSSWSGSSNRLESFCIKFSDFTVKNSPRRIWSMSRQIHRISNIFKWCSAVFCHTSFVQPWQSEHEPCSQFWEEALELGLTTKAQLTWVKHFQLPFVAIHGWLAGAYLILTAFIKPT